MTATCEFWSGLLICAIAVVSHWVMPVNHPVALSGSVTDCSFCPSQGNLSQNQRERRKPRSPLSRSP